MGRPTRLRSETFLVCSLAAALVLAAAPAGRADEASEHLAKYRVPVDKAIDRALAFLAEQQWADGSFPESGPARGRGGQRYSGRGESTAVTGLCVMAFLAKGYTPGTGPYGQTINKGIDFVLGEQQDNGVLARRAGRGAMYHHGICTLMLSEVSGMVDPARQRRIDAALSKALKAILSAQKVHKDRRHDGGWRYQLTSSDSDISCTGWQVMALRSARANGAQVPKEAIDKAVGFIMNCRARDGGFCYQPGGSPGLARTGTALLCLELCGRHGEKVTLQAGDWIRREFQGRYGGSHFYYGLYYCSQGMFQLGGEYWKSWGERMYQMMLKYQRSDGSWPSVQVGTCYSTAMGVLAMSVSYRQLPIYQR